jgi:adenylate cyclase, class 2
MTGPTESELKIPVADLGAVRSRLEAGAATLLAPRYREVNTLYDDADRRLRSAGHALRLRRSEGRWTLTFKGPVRYRGTVKEREELETEVAEGAVVAAIFGRLGLVASRRYEKDRERWRVAEAEVCLDHTAMGDFVEIEGPLDALGEVAAGLGLDPAGALRGSYVSLWASYRDEHPELGLPEDMVFAP